MTTTFDNDVHGENTCADVEAMLTEVTEAMDSLRDENVMLKAVDASRQAEMDALRLREARREALFAEMRKKMGNLSNVEEGLGTQVQILLEELKAAEADAVPADSLTHGIVRHADVLAAYREVSRVNRGPLPPAITEAMDEAAPEIRAAMEVAGQEALRTVMRRAVRNRNVSLGLTPTGRPRRVAVVAGARSRSRTPGRKAA